MRVLGYALYGDSARYATEQMNFDWVGLVNGPTLFDVSLTTKMSNKIKKKTLPKADLLVSSARNDDSERVFDIALQIGASYVIWDLGERGNDEVAIRKTKSLFLFQIADWNTVLLENVSMHNLGLNFKENRTFLLASKFEHDLLVEKKRINYSTKPLSVILNTEKDETLVPVIEPKTGRLYHKNKAPYNALNTTLSDFHLQIQYKLNPKCFPNPYIFDGKVHTLRPSEVATMVGCPPKLRRTFLRKFVGAKKAIFCMIKDPSVLVWKDLMQRWVRRPDFLCEL